MDVWREQLRWVCVEYRGNIGAASVRAKRRAQPRQGVPGAPLASRMLQQGGFSRQEARGPFNPSPRLGQEDLSWNENIPESGGRCAVVGDAQHW